MSATLTNANRISRARILRRNVTNVFLELPQMLISKVEMTLSKVDLEVAHHYMTSLGSPENRDAFTRIFEIISIEYSLTKKMVLDITGHQRLLGADPALQLSVDLRNRTIVPLGFL